MTLNYPVYDLRTGRRSTFGPTTGAWGDTYGSPIFTGPEFLHVLKYFKSKGFHVYANLAYGGVNRTAHSTKSWHYQKDANGISLGADMGTYGDVNERNRIINEVIPVLDRIGMGWHYARNGHVPNHHNHIHIDVSNWGRKGGSAASGYGFYRTYKKQNPFTALPLGGGSATIVPIGSTKTRKPKRIAAYYGMKGNLVRIVQRIAGAKVDGSYGPATVRAVKALQKRLGVRQDGNFGPATARAYFNTLPLRRRGTSGYSVQLLQWIAGISIDGSFGPATETAVKEMQRWAGISTDGLVGPLTRSKIFI